MVQTPTVPVEPAGFAQARARQFGFHLNSRRSPAPLAVVVPDEQIVELVSAAHRLSQRQRDRRPTVTTAALHEQLLRLDWAVRAGRPVLADRAAVRALSLPWKSTTAVAQRRQDGR